MFVSFFASFLDPKARTLTYSSAGHNPTYLLRPGCETQPLKSGGPVLGALEDSRFDVDTVQLQPGDLLIYYTDGVTEAHNLKGELFGEERLLDLSNRLFGADSASEAVEIIRSEVVTFAAGTPQYDDLTVVVVRAT